MRKFKIRASSAGEMMTGTIGLTDKQQQRHNELFARHVDKDAKPLTANMESELADLTHRKANPTLPKTVQTLCKKWFIGEYFGKRRLMGTKETLKGIKNEDISIEMLSEKMDLMLEKNEKRFEHDPFFEGTPDIIVPGELVIDIKNPWDVFTFPWFDDQPDDGYYHQLQTYMALTDTPKAQLVYTLTNASDEQIEKEVFKYASAMGLDPTSAALFEEFKENMTFDNVPFEKRFKIFEFERDDKVITEMRERVVMCRSYIETLKKMFN